MTESKLFNLEKIKSLTSALDVLQAKMHQLNENSDNFNVYKQSVIPTFSNEVLLAQIEEMTELMITVKSKLEKISMNNVVSFLVVQENLIQKYKEKKKDS